MLRTESIPNPTSEVVMAINVGDAVPDIEVRVLDEGGMPTSVQTGDVLGTGKVVLFAVPGAFTTGCTMVHLPTFVEGASDLAGEGVDTIATDQNGVVRVRTNPKFFRPAEVDLLIGDPAYAKQKLGWETKTTFEQLIQMMVESDLAIVQEAVDGGYAPPTPPE